jgi:hypothetical protein
MITMNNDNDGDKESLTGGLLYPALKRANRKGRSGMEFFDTARIHVSGGDGGTAVSPFVGKRENHAVARTVVAVGVESSVYLEAVDAQYAHMPCQRVRERLTVENVGQ